MTTAAAVKANATRRVDADIAILRRHFDGEGKNEDRLAIADFLAMWTPNEWYLGLEEPTDARGKNARPAVGPVGDLQGPGESARELRSRGLQVLAAENLSWTRTKLAGDRARAEAAALRMADRDGYEVVIGDFLDIVPRLSTANYDPCAIPTGRVREVVRAMVEARLVAFAVTVLLSRIPGMKDRDNDFYDLGTDAQMAKDAHGYALVDKRRYIGTANVPMATYCFVRGRAHTIYEELRAKYLYTALDALTPEFDQRMAAGAVANYLWDREKKDMIRAHPGHVPWCRCKGDNADMRCLDLNGSGEFVRALIAAHKEAIAHNATRRAAEGEA